MSGRPRVLFVSKAVAPPFHDGAICLVRGLATALKNYEPSVLTTTLAPPLSPSVRNAAIYKKPSRFSPPILDNVRALLALARDFSHDIWHFVFAPNYASSKTGAIIKALKKRPTVQTVASKPRRFENSNDLLFGDHIIAVSKHTADGLVKHRAVKQISVVPPPIDDITVDNASKRKAREEAGIDHDAPLFIYAGDLEFSSGADMMASATPSILREVPNAIVAFVCRTKTPRAAQRKCELADRLRDFGSRVMFLGEVNSLPSLLSTACALPFPVDDLYGKVDHPYVVLEAALLQVPALVIDKTPLEEIHGTQTMQYGDTKALAGWCVDMARDSSARSQIGSAFREAVLKQHNPTAVASAVEDIYDKLLNHPR